VPGQGWQRDNREEAKLISYLVKYLVKCWHQPGQFRKKLWGGSASARIGTTRFKWAPWVKPGSYIYAAGKEAWESFHQGEVCSFMNMSACMALGLSALGWASRWDALIWFTWDRFINDT
jgi:hypothetical protein